MIKYCSAGRLTRSFSDRGLASGPESDSGESLTLVTGVRRCPRTEKLSPAETLQEWEKTHGIN